MWFKKNLAANFQQESLLAICHVTRSKFFFVASEETILPLNVELQLQVKHQIGPITQHSHGEAKNNYVLLTEQDVVEHCSVEFE